MAGDVEKVLKVLVAGTEQRPDRARPLVDTSRFPLSGVITQECSIQTRVCVLHQLHLQHPHTFALLLVKCVVFFLPPLFHLFAAKHLSFEDIPSA